MCGGGNWKTMQPILSILLVSRIILPRIRNVTPQFLPIDVSHALISTLRERVEVMKGMTIAQAFTKVSSDLTCSRSRWDTFGRFVTN